MTNPMHTPTPWRVAPAKDYASSELNIDAGPRGQLGFICAAGHRGDPEAEANAALIVRAVNAHDELVGSGRAFFNEACAIFDSDLIKHKDAGAYSHFRSARERLRIAIAKATGAA